MDNAQQGKSRHVTWELLWLNTIVKAWGDEQFRNSLLDHGTTRSCLDNVLSQICRQLEEAGHKHAEQHARVAALGDEQGPGSSQQLQSILPEWVDLTVTMPEPAINTDHGWYLPPTQVKVQLPPLDDKASGQECAETLIRAMTIVRLGGWPFNDRPVTRDESARVFSDGA
ncbi:MAG: hypothetical protein QM784_09580 [Polyangiaceae bacterium]